MLLRSISNTRLHPHSLILTHPTLILTHSASLNLTHSSSLTQPHSLSLTHSASLTQPHSLTSGLIKYTNTPVHTLTYALTCEWGVKHALTCHQQHQKKRVAEAGAGEETGHRDPLDLPMQQVQSLLPSQFLSWHSLQPYLYS